MQHTRQVPEQQPAPPERLGRGGQRLSRAQQLLGEQLAQVGSLLASHLHKAKDTQHLSRRGSVVRLAGPPPDQPPTQGTLRTSSSSHVQCPGRNLCDQCNRCSGLHCRISMYTHQAFSVQTACLLQILPGTGHQESPPRQTACCLSWSTRLLCPRRLLQECMAGRP